MCLIFFACQAHPRYRLILAANRDEFYRRPTLPAHQWSDPPDIIAGRDSIGGGTWLGVTSNGRWAAITNYRSGAERTSVKGRSRGLLVSDFLAGGQSPADFIHSLTTIDHDYRGFNLLAGDRDTTWYYSNRSRAPQELQSGCYGLSNHLLDTPWPKLRQGKADFKGVIKQTDVDNNRLFGLLADRDTPPDDELPDTGFGLSWERILAPRFIRSADYGTRSSTILLIAWDGAISLRERTFERDPRSWKEVLIQAGD